jgi:hypothetical protein
MNNNVKQIPVNKTNLEEIAGKDLRLNSGEGVLYTKFVLLTPETIKGNPDLEAHINNQPAFIFCGDLDEIQLMLNQCLEDVKQIYSERLDEQNKGTENE